MKRKWQPSKSQRREFAGNMQDDNFRNEYESRKRERAERRREDSQFGYNSAGGSYCPTFAQYRFAMNAERSSLTPEEQTACDVVVSGFVGSEKVHHDNIHLVNELIRREV